jgi:hypothetical protein
VVGAALVLLAAGQTGALLLPRDLPPGASVEVLPNGFSYATTGDTAQLGFQLRNSGDRSLRITAVGTDLPGLELVDVVASGEPFGFTAVGAGGEPLPEFDLTTGTVIEINLAYSLGSCGAVPRDSRPVPVTARTGRSRGVLAVPLPGLPADAVGSGPDDEDPWQQVLVRDLCG